MCSSAPYRAMCGRCGWTSACQSRTATRVVALEGTRSVASSTVLSTAVARLEGVTALAPGKACSRSRGLSAVASTCSDRRTPRARSRRSKSSIRPRLSKPRSRSNALSRVTVRALCLWGWSSSASCCTMSSSVWVVVSCVLWCAGDCVGTFDSILHQLKPGCHHQTKLAVGRAQGLFHFPGRSTAGEDETGVTRSLWKGTEFFGGFGGDGDVFNTGHTAGRLEPLDAFPEASAGNGEHHRPSSALFTGEAGNLQAAGVSNEQFGEGHPGPKA